MKHPEESPILFGPSSALFGVLTRPSHEAAAPVACLMFNFGIHSHIGPRRIQVKLARLLAAQGIASLRFDLSGIGESPPPRTALPFEAQALQDLKAAVDHIESTLGIRQVAVIGLCSGVAHGLRFALQDPRVVGLLSFDGYRFAGSQANAARRFQRFLRLPVAQSVHWIKRLMGAQQPKDNMLQTNEPEHPVTPADFERGMDALVARDVVVHLIYSATMQSK
ncbi:MAG: alpha/beta fold hydrolase, partial [Comamonadaceae bacterium]